MVRLVIDIDTSDIIGVKELIAMALELLGNAQVVQCQEMDEQIGLEDC